MPGESPRPFTVGDAMLFIAALALGTFAIRTAFPDPSILWSKLILDDPPGYWYSWLLQVSLSAVTIYLVFLTPAMLVARLRKPRPGLSARSAARFDRMCHRHGRTALTPSVSPRNGCRGPAFSGYRPS